MQPLYPSGTPPPPRRDTRRPHVLSSFSLLLAGALLLTQPYQTWSEGKVRGVAVRLTSPKLVQAKPGSIVTGAFLVSNETDQSEELFEGPEALKPLELVTPASGSLPLLSELGPGQAEPRIVAVAVPAGAPAGTYQVLYSAASRRHPGLSDLDSFTVLVLPVRKVQLLVQEKPATVIAGGTYKVNFRLVNRGNVAAELDLDLAAAPDSPKHLDRARVSLAPGGSTVVHVAIKTPEDLRESVSQTVTLRIKSGAETSISESVVVRVLPRTTGAYDPYHRLQARVGAGALGEWTHEGRETAWRFEAAGSGTLDEAGERRLEFLLRGPDTRRVGRYGQLPEYRLSFSAPTWAFRLGEWAYSLSPLTEAFRWGRGAEASASHGRAKAGVLYVRDLQGGDGQETGGHVSYDATEWLQLRANVLAKAGDEKLRASDGTLYSVEAGAHAGRSLNLALEYARSDGSVLGDAPQKAQAFRVDARGALPGGVAYSLQKTRGGADYRGRYRDVDILHANSTIPLSDRLSANLSLRTYADNLSHDARSATATKERFVQSGLSYALARPATLRLEYETLARKDDFRPADFDFDERLLRVGLGLSGQKATLQGYASRGVFEDHRTDSRRDDLEQYSLFAHVRPTQGQTYSAFATVGHDSFVTETPQRVTSLGLDATWTGTGKRFNTGWRRDERRRAPPADRLYAQLQWERSNGHTVTVQADRDEHPVRANRRSALFVGYSVPVGIPVAKKTSIGALRGQIRDGEDGRGGGLSGVIVYVDGATAVTDARGEFLFPALKPGEYQLLVDAKSLGFGRITTVKLPLAVRVRPGEEERLDLQTASAARVCGRALVASTAGGRTLQENDGRTVLLGGVEESRTEATSGTRALPNILVELTRDGERLRELTDHAGRFCFRDLRPGSWSLRANSEGLPAQHTFERERLALQLLPGTETAAEFKAVPRARTIQILEEGEIVVASPVKGETARNAAAAKPEAHGSMSGVASEPKRPPPSGPPERSERGSQIARPLRSGVEEPHDDPTPRESAGLAQAKLAAKAPLPEPQPAGLAPPQAPTGKELSPARNGPEPDGQAHAAVDKTPGNGRAAEKRMTSRVGQDEAEEERQASEQVVTSPSRTDWTAEAAGLPDQGPEAAREQGETVARQDGERDAPSGQPPTAVAARQARTEKPSPVETDGRPPERTVQLSSVPVFSTPRAFAVGALALLLGFAGVRLYRSRAGR